MDAVIFIGIQATGKSTFFHQRFRDSHVRINLDMLRTRHRESLLVEACLQGKQPLVIDNTNPTAEERARYIRDAKAARFLVRGYFFESRLVECIQRNRLREENRQVPEVGIKGTRSRLQLPCLEEGFDELWFVRIGPEGFEVEPWDEV